MDRPAPRAVRRIDFNLPIDSRAPTNFEMNSFMQMVTHSIKCQFRNCYLTGGPLSCRNMKAVLRHLGVSMRNCRCEAQCLWFARLYKRHMVTCNKPAEMCPFILCSSTKLKWLRRQTAPPPPPPPNSTATSPRRQQARTDGTDQNGQNSNVDRTAMEQ